MERKTVKGIIIAVCVVIVLVGIVLGLRSVWSYGDVSPSSYPAIRLAPVAGSVQWKRQGEADWKKLDAPVDIFPGDQIKTAKDGQAKLVWGDQGDTRIASSTVMTVQAAPSAGQPMNNRVIRLQVESGRIWSRFVKLIDPSSRIEAHVGDVVATVRGTSFGLSREATSTWIAVSDSVVAIGAPTEAEDAKTLVRDGMIGSFATSSQPIGLRSLGKTDGWALAQQVQDKQEWDEWKQQELSQIQKLNNEAPNGSNAVIGLVERAHLFLIAGEKRDVQFDAYREREWARAWSQGASPSLPGSDLPTTATGRERLQWTVQRYLQLALLEQRPDWIQNLRAWREVLATTPASRFYVDAVSLDEDVDQAILPQGLIAAEQAHPAMIDALRKRLADLKLQVGLQSLPTGDQQVLRLRLAATEARLDDGSSAAAANLPPVLVTPDTSPIITVPSPAPAPTSTNTIPVPTQKPTEFTRVALFANPTTINLGERSSLKLVAVHADGSSVDVTSRSTFSVTLPSDGTVTGNVFMPSRTGDINVFGTYNDNGTNIFASAVVSVGKVAVKSLSSLTVTSNLTSLGCNQTIPFHVVAYYTDGSSQDVTIMSKISVSDPQVLGFSGDQVLTLCPAQPSSAVITASYTENGVTQSGSLKIDVTPDPNTAPSGTKSRRIP